MLNIVCLKWGTLYGPEYVNILFDMVRRNLKEGYPGKFICYTDDATGLDAGIEARPMPTELEGWWGKLWLFSQHTEGKTLFLDLDTVIVGALDALVEHDAKFTILRDFYRPNGLQSSVMMWRGDLSYIYYKWVQSGSPRIDGGDQAWIEQWVEGAGYWEDSITDYNKLKVKQDGFPSIWQDEFPGDFVSYKANGCEAGVPKGAKMIIFHGEPRPHQAKGWVEKVWKVGGGTTAELMVVSNVEVSKLIENREFNTKRGLEEIKMQEPHQKTAVIVAGGPSLLEYAHDLPDGDIFSVNGTLRFLTERNIRPDYHVMCDARPENIEFLNGAWVNYLMASQVDPSLIDALGKREATLWHIALPGAKPMPMQIGGATTVGLLSVVLAYVMGYRTIHMLGFDSSYGESHHAYPQKLNDGERIIDVTVGDTSFRCAPWMAQQAREFADVIPELVRMGCEISVHGYGLIPTLAESMMTPRIAADERAEEILSRLPDGSIVGAEIGVFYGDLSRRLLQRNDLTLHMVDAWAGSGESYDGDSDDFHATLSQDQQDECERLAKSVTAFAGDRAIVHKAFSHEAASKFDANSLDFVFIDADHGYEGCKRDLHAWWPVVKSGGVFSGHDYENTQFPKFGVKRAVDEFAQEFGLTVSIGQNFTWFITKPLQENT